MISRAGDAVATLHLQPANGQKDALKQKILMRQQPRVLNEISVGSCFASELFLNSVEKQSYHVAGYFFLYLPLREGFKINGGGLVILLASACLTFFVLPQDRSRLLPTRMCSKIRSRINNNYNRLLLIRIMNVGWKGSSLR